jgi:hypothetical protein
LFPVIDVDESVVSARAEEGCEGGMVVEVVIGIDLTNTGSARRVRRSLDILTDGMT